MYDAEAAAGAHDSRPFADIGECTNWIKACLDTGLIEQDYPTFRTYVYADNKPGVLVIRERRKSKIGTVAHATSTTLAFTQAGMKTWIALHELAHMIVARRDGRVGYSHGWQFCETYLKLVGWFIGYKEQAMLRDEFDKRGVGYQQPMGTSYLRMEVG